MGQTRVKPVSQFEVKHKLKSSLIWKSTIYRISSHDPGRMNVDMLAAARIRGLYCVPGVPNTTQVTQELDQNYGLFKTIYRQNLLLLAQKRFDSNRQINVNDLPLLVFGYQYTARDGTTKVYLRDAFSEAFSIDNCLSAWKKVGAEMFH
jgi:hypothetical protein